MSAPAAPHRRRRGLRPGQRRWTARCATSASRTAASWPSLPDGAPTLDARGMVVMPGGVDIHSHVASSSCNHARRLLPEEHAADPAPAPALLDRASAGPLGHRRHGSEHLHHRLPLRRPRLHHGVRRGGRAARRRGTPTASSTTRRSSTPASSCCMGNDDYLLRQIAAGERGRARDYAAWLLGADRRLRDQDRQPGRRRGVEDGGSATSPGSTTRSGRAHGHAAARSSRRWPTRRTRSTCRIRCTSTATTSACRATRRPRSRACRRSRAGARTSPTSSSTATAASGGQGLESAAREGHRVRQRAPRGERGRRPGDVRSRDHAHRRRAGRVPAAHEQRPQVGQRRHRAGDRLRHRAATPTRRRRRSRRCSGRSGSSCSCSRADPWRVVLSTDHPNGGSFLAYPELIRLLMDRSVPRRAAQARQPEAPRRQRAGRRPRPRVHAQRDRDHHPRRPGPAARPRARRATWAPAPTPT